MNSMARFNLKSLRNDDPDQWDLAKKIFFGYGLQCLSRIEKTDNLSDEERHRIISDAFSILFEKYLWSAASEGKFINLFRKTVKSKAMDHIAYLERGKRNVRLPQGFGDSPETINATSALQLEDVCADQPDEAFLRKERIYLLDNALPLLSMACRELIEQHHLKDATIRDIATRLGKAKSTVDSQLKKCQEALRAELRKMDAACFPSENGPT